MTTIAASHAEPLHGVRQIVRFNWPFYAAGVTGVLAVPAIVNSVPLGIGWRVLLYVSAGAACLWIGGSLFASWTVYDRSELMSGRWLIRALGLMHVRS